MQNATVATRKSVTICFAGDSGDGMQLTGAQFTHTSALAGNDLATFPDFPAEIRAPAGTRPGVSGFQLQISSDKVFTPGDAPEVLVAMNPAALVTSLGKLRSAGTIIVNTDKFTDREFKKAEIEVNPLTDGSLDEYFVIEVPLGKLTKTAVAELGLGAKEADRCKNFFALGITYWLYSRDSSFTRKWIEGKFKEPYRTANLRALEAGWSFAETLQLLERRFDVPSAQLEPGTYRNVNGNEALAMGFAAAAQRSGLQVFLGSYPITPASDLLHHLAKLKHLGVTTFQAEDEIAAVCAAVGAAYAGAIGLTSTSGPGLALKGEAMGLAVMTELPLVIVNVQRGGPSTGLPTKTEQSDLLMAFYGRNGEAPMAILAPSTPADCFWMAHEACRLALHTMGPVMILSDGYLANGTEPWRLPKVSDIPDIQHRLVTESNNPDGDHLPYKRDPDTLARDWAVPGTPGVTHRIGGLEKQEDTGNVSYDPANHQRMCELRAEKVARVANVIPEQDVDGPTSGPLLVLSWGSTFGSVRQAVLGARAHGHDVAHAHVRYLNPFPKNFEALLRSYDRVLVPEMNLGQLSSIVRDKFLLDVVPLNKIQGQPFKVGEVRDAIDQLLEA
jgi:2-oxoglutarate ferredoxin oxidoreductase subunit alpha